MPAPPLSLALQRITLQMTSSLDVEEVLRTLTQGLVEELGVVSSQVWLVDQQPATDEPWRLAAAAGLARTLEPPERRRALAGFRIQEIAEQGEPLLVHPLGSGEVLPPDASAEARQLVSFVGCPLIFQGRTLGVLASFAPQPLGPEEAQLLDLFARQAAIALGNARLHAEVARLKDRYEAESRYHREEYRQEHGCADIVGESVAIRRLTERIDQVAATDTTVLIQGETGTGKELAALAVHQRSRRRDGALIKINCGAISPGLAESELFGHEKGAFTGAVARRTGRFELAHGGTLFLDEVGELPPDLQVKLLRVLQEGEFERVGSERPVQVDVRVIAATNRSLAEEVETGGFRADLYYRLAVFPLEVPPLRDRPGDVPLLARCFLGRLANRMGKDLTGFTAGSLEALAGYPWPGNVRELLNVVERAAILSPGPEVDLTLGLDTSRARAAKANPVADSPRRTLEEVEREHLATVLEVTDWVIEGPDGAAEILGLAPSTLRSRMGKLGLRRPGR